jgi:hypothetical protein
MKLVKLSDCGKKSFIGSSFDFFVEKEIEEQLEVDPIKLFMTKLHHSCVS